jgi:RimJ/RimL family protein N-acetyltransferase
MRFWTPCVAKARGAEDKTMIHLKPVTLEGYGMRLEPLTLDHAPDIAEAASDGKLWELWFTTVPAPGEETTYIQTALDGWRDGHMLPWAVRDLKSGDIVGSTRYHDIMADIDRVEIGYTFYAKRCQRTGVNTSCKLLLLRHGFDTLGCQVVGLRTDVFNLASQNAIEKLGALREGVIRHSRARRDGSVRDTVMYSILRSEWPAIRERLEARLKNGGSKASPSTAV